MIHLLLSCSLGSLSIEESNKLIEERYENLCTCLKEISAKEENTIVVEKQHCLKQYELSSSFRLDLEKRVTDLNDEEKKKLYVKINSLNSKNCE